MEVLIPVCKVSGQNVGYLHLVGRCHPDCQMPKRIGGICLKKYCLSFLFLKRVYAEKASEFWRLDARFKINV